ncbi:hypothetical protein HTZ85_08795 [Escherichia coli]|nr:hypothetical protein [Escherichia coli]
MNKREWLWKNEHQYSGARCSGQAAYVAKRQECAK